ncbi:MULTISPECIES: LPXTG cell wall anchor domain-containing protein [Streptococcus]|uniref:LPXTG cell wall anchor domain-containing protein n=1 Tax=Streptococcus caledonicus TaxID=2614158 RepID=A0ABW0UGI1_9STRE|nr:LPXTG cell wall anchor domain-containing protein [Streptococcus sp. S784/96/1]
MKKLQPNRKKHERLSLLGVGTIATVLTLGAFVLTGEQAKANTITSESSAIPTPSEATPDTNSQAETATPAEAGNLQDETYRSELTEATKELVTAEVQLDYLNNTYEPALEEVKNSLSELTSKSETDYKVATETPNATDSDKKITELMVSYAYGANAGFQQLWDYYHFTKDSSKAELQAIIDKYEEEADPKALLSPEEELFILEVGKQTILDMQADNVATKAKRDTLTQEAFEKYSEGLKNPNIAFEDLKTLAFIAGQYMGNNFVPALEYDFTELDARITDLKAQLNPATQPPVPTTPTAPVTPTNLEKVSSTSHTKATPTSHTVQNTKSSPTLPTTGDQSATPQLIVGIVSMGLSGILLNRRRRNMN